eukprot:TRINITY_DN1233_c0_g1_i1.p1 TRINITY_DN1233_c0_g1~~TRINITY_DN1233_c0_g1_i1.p1  ORF type:complete len:566 (-),score=77.40 TRINITY_DN1233_c0_g1_i1:709-2406(-)
MDIDSMGNMWLGGFTNAAFPGHSNSGGSDLFLMQADTADGKVWNMLQQGTAINDRTDSVVVDRKTDRVYTAGSSGNLFDGNAGSADLFVRLQRTDCFPANFQPFGCVCSPGSQLNHTTGNCSACPMDTYNPLFSSQVNSNQCLACPANRFSVAGSTSCPFAYPGWELQIGTAQNDIPGGISTCDDGSVFVVGSVANNAALPGQSTSGSTDAFVLRFAPNGTLANTIQFGTAGADYAHAVTADCSTKQFWVIGRTSSTFPNPQPYKGSGTDGFIRKYDWDGNDLFTTQFGSTTTDFARDVDHDPSGNTFVCGYLNPGSLLGQPALGGTDNFVIRFNSTGGIDWVKQFGSASTDRAHAIVTSRDYQTIIVAGYTHDPPYEGIMWPGSQHVFVSRFKASTGEHSKITPPKHSPSHGHLHSPTFSFSLTTHSQSHLVCMVHYPYQWTCCPNPWRWIHPVIFSSLLKDLETFLGGSILVQPLPSSPKLMATLVLKFSLQSSMDLHPQTPPLPSQSMAQAMSLSPDIQLVHHQVHPIPVVWVLSSQRSMEHLVSPNGPDLSKPRQWMKIRM